MAQVIKDAFAYSTVSFFTASAMSLNASASTLNPPMGDQSNLFITIAIIAMAVAAVAIAAVLIISARNKKK